LSELSSVRRDRGKGKSKFHRRWLSRSEAYQTDRPFMFSRILTCSFHPWLGPEEAGDLAIRGLECVL
jgi:hypothetical protein